MSGNMLALNDEDTFLRLKQNDPDLTKLFIAFGQNCFASTIDWEKDGGFLGENNTNLKYLSVRVIYNDDINVAENDAISAKVRDFFSCLAHNRSIESLSIIGTEISSLAPFFEHNENISSLDLCECSMGTESTIHSILSRRKNKMSLQSISLHHNGLESEIGGEIINTLSGYQNITSISFADDKFGRKGFAALAKILNAPMSKVSELCLNSTDMNDDDAKIISSALANNKSLRTLSLENNRSVSDVGWEAFSDAFHNSNSGIEEISLDHSGINSLGIVEIRPGQNYISSLTSSMVTNMLSGVKKLKKLQVSTTMSTPEWEEFFTQLKNPSLESLCLSRCHGLDTLGTFALADMLVDNTTIKSLDLSRNESNISSQGWRNLFQRLTNSNCVLENLNLSGNGITDHEVTYLSRALARMSSLKTLNLGDNELADQSWRELSNLLQSETLAPKELQINSNHSFNNDPLMTFSNGLVNNKTLRTLWLGMFNPRWEGLTSLTNVLCNTSSIDATYSSNHTLETICDKWFFQRMPHDLLFNLQANKNANKFEAARHKILKTHFSTENANMVEFIGMDFNALPCAISWLGMDNDGYSVLYQLLRCIPLLFDVEKRNTKKAAGTKRKLELPS